MRDLNEIKLKYIDIIGKKNKLFREMRKRAIIDLYYNDGLSYNQIARVFEISKQLVSYYIKKYKK